MLGYFGVPALKVYVMPQPPSGSATVVSATDALTIEQNAELELLEKEHGTQLVRNGAKQAHVNELLLKQEPT